MSASHFLRLPLELRDCIYNHIFGQRTVHVRSESFRRFRYDDSSYDLFRTPILYNSDFRNLHEPESQVLYTDALCFDKCYESIDERLAYKLSRQTNPHDPFGLIPNCRGPLKQCRYCQHHQSCRYYEGGAFDRNVPGFALLLVSQQVHREAEAILYGSTTFSFCLAYTLERFVNVLGPVRRQLVKSLHLDIARGFLAGGWSWPSDDLASAIQLLPRLHSLHIRIQHHSPSLCRLHDGDCQTLTYNDCATMLREGNLSLWEDDLVHLQHPMLQDVTVIIEDDGQYHLTPKSAEMMREDGQWTMAERAQFAQLIKEKILAPRDTMETDVALNDSDGHSLTEIITI